MHDMPSAGPFAEWLEGWQEWVDREDIVEGTPFLLSPEFEYDVEMNDFFRSSLMEGRPQNTLDAYVRDMAGFFTFLWTARGGKGWRDADEDDHLAYRAWRVLRLRRAGATWGREVATVNVFYEWAVERGLVAVNPIPQRAARARPVQARGSRLARAGGTTPATGPHNARRDRIEWVPPKSYRQWRDVGLRGYRADGLPGGFRGRWAARNATFTDLMSRTGMRVSEQDSLTVFDLPRQPSPRGRGYQRFWLTAAIAKGGSQRWVYVPVPLVRELALYAEVDRAKVIEAARRRGAYDRIRRPLVVTDPDRPDPEVLVPGQGGSRDRVRLSRLKPLERRRTFLDNGSGLEPVAFWVSEDGMPLTVSAWKGIFGEANRRCAQAGIDVRCHPHMLRHTFAVVTLEQLQRGHIRDLSEMSPSQRTHYTQVFGDPLDWVRRRLGHQSVVTTQVYLHCLAELEMTTRMALVPELWEDPRETPLEAVGDDLSPPGEPAGPGW
jgi:site-specific recombinase XerD